MPAQRSYSALVAWLAAIAFIVVASGFTLHAADYQSYPPLRKLAEPSKRAKSDGQARFVDAARGDDAHDGSESKPWKTINHALPQLNPGETLYLRQGSYFENIYCAIAGTPERPITIRSYPGELATIDGGLPEFQRDPMKAWEPVEGGKEGEYRSTATHKNIRDVVGLFGDSNVGLQTYWYRMDLQADNELWITDPATFIKPMYCGPGIWYDKQTGRVHARLAHTKLQLPDSVDHHLVRYQGETDPRKLPLVVAPFDSIPLTVSQAMHVRFEDLVFRGGGYITVKLLMGIDIVFDRCTIYAGTYGIWSKGTGPLKMTQCGVYGMMAPWMWRSENVLNSYSGKSYPPFLDEPAPVETGAAITNAPKRVTRHISRLPTHALLVTEGGYEFETFYHPHNHDWDVSYCDFTDAHDGIYPSGRDVRFHHNLIDNMQDDPIYISSPTAYISDGVYFYQNLIRCAITGIGAHSRGGPTGKIYIYRNVIDLRDLVQFNRPTPDKLEGTVIQGATGMLVHNSNNMIGMEHIYIYQNTALVPSSHVFGSYTANFPFGTHPDMERRVFNNLCVYYGGAKSYPIAFGYKTEVGNIVLDGNLHWHADPSVKLPPATYFDTSRKHVLSELNKKFYPDGWDAHSIVADPKFVSFSNDKRKAIDLRLQPDSPAVKAGVPLPTEWLDPLRPTAGQRPDIGALPLDGEPLRVGVDGRTTAGDPK